MTRSGRRDAVEREGVSRRPPGSVRRSAPTGRGAAAALSAALLVSPLLAQDRDPSGVALDGWLEGLVAQHALPAAGAAVADSQRILASGAVGVRAMGKGAAVTPEDRWHVGSITKSFTAALLALLIERGELDWDSTLGELFEAPESPAAAITVDQLLSHRSGLAANLTLQFTSELVGTGGSVVEQRRRVVERVLLQGPEAEPGSRYEYSNLGYIVAGAIAESVAGRSWEELVSEEVAEPLGIEVGFGAPGTLLELDQPLGHRAGVDGRLIPIEPGPLADNPPLLGPAGTIHLTLWDLLRWGQVNLGGEGGEGGEGTLLRPESWRRLHRALEGQDYARGWVDEERPWEGDRRVIWHNGSNGMWYALVAFVPEDGLALALVTNGSIEARLALDESLETLWRRGRALGERAVPEQIEGSAAGAARDG